MRYVCDVTMGENECTKSDNRDLSLCAVKSQGMVSPINISFLLKRLYNRELNLSDFKAIKTFFMPISYQKWKNIFPNLFLIILEKYVY